MLSLIVPARNWPVERIEACVRSFLRLKSAALGEIVVVDFGSEQPIVLGIRDKRVRVVRVLAERWSLAEAINVGVVASRGEIVAKTDADIIIARESGRGLDAAVNAIAAGEVGLAVVQAIDLPPGLDAARALRMQTGPLVREGRLRPRWGQGGLCFFSRATWADVGGFESRFHGWGNEDNDFADRVRRSGRRMRWMGPELLRIFHVAHAPSYVAHDIHEAREANRRVYLGDKSTFRSLRFRHSRSGPLASPSIVTSARPLVTVAFASKARPNRERMLTEAIKGFAGQIDNDFEVLVVDNGSTAEESAKLRKSLAKLPRAIAPRVIDLDQASIPAARNRLTDEARGRYVCIADDDDIPMPGRLADHLAVFETRPGIHGSHGGWIDFDEVTGIVDFNPGGERTLASLLYGPGKISAHPASLVRTDVMRHFRYDESSRIGSDFDLAIRMANMGCRIEHTGSYVTLRRFHTANVTITDLADQRMVGVDARARVSETLGNAFSNRLREIAREGKNRVACRNSMPAGEVLPRLPGYVGIWRLLVPLSQLNRPKPPERNGALLQPSPVAPWRREEDEPAPLGIPLAANDGAVGISIDTIRPAGLPESSADIVDVARTLEGIVTGDVGVVDCGVNPTLFFVSDRVKGIRRALKLKAAVEEQLDLVVEVVTDVEYERRRSTRFDWSVLAKQSKEARLLSAPMALDAALAALTRLPANTALRAMTAMLADFNCTEQLFHLVTAPLKLEDGPARIRRILERQTGETFQMVAPPFAQPSAQAGRGAA